MPVHHAILFDDLNLDQPAAARPAAARARVRPVHRAMGRADQPLAGIVKKTVRLEVQLHRHVGAAVQVRVRAALEADREGAAGLAAKDHVERDRLTALLQIGRMTQGNELAHAAPAQPWRRSHSCRSCTEWATWRGPNAWKSSGSCAP